MSRTDVREKKIFSQLSLVFKATQTDVMLTCLLPILEPLKSRQVPTEVRQSKKERMVSEKKKMKGTCSGTHWSRINKFLQKRNLYYRISANSFRGNYSFLNLALFTVTFDLYFINLNSCRGNYSREETIRGNTIFMSVRNTFTQKRTKIPFSQISILIYDMDRDDLHINYVVCSIR